MKLVGPMIGKFESEILYIFEAHGTFWSFLLAPDTVSLF